MAPQRNVAFLTILLMPATLIVQAMRVRTPGGAANTPTGPVRVRLNVTGPTAAGARNRRIRQTERTRARTESTKIEHCGDGDVFSGQGQIIVPNCKGAGCRAGGRNEDCAFCVYDIEKCVRRHGKDHCNWVNRDRLAQGISGCGFNNAEAQAYRRLQTLLHPMIDGPIDIVEALELFKGFKPLFAKGGVSEDSWGYAWRHLPSNIMDNPNTKYILHAAPKHYKTNASAIYTHSGWDVEGGAYIDAKDNCKDAANLTGCTVHVNLRDLKTDIDEFLSTLLLHMVFLQERQNQMESQNSEAMDGGRSITICRDHEDPEKSCRGKDKCELIVAAPCNKDWSKTVSFIPSYTVELDGVEPESMLKSLTDSWRIWAEEVKDGALAVAKCNSDRLRVHLIQGATQAIWLMTSKLAVEYTAPDDVRLRGKYGGPYEEQDRNYAALTGNINKNWSLWGGKVNDENGEKHLYIKGSGPHAVNAEVIGLESWAEGEVDPIVTQELLAATVEGRKCAVIVNVGYAFGSSALPMGQALKETFGSALQSFYVIGKAGGLVGSLGDYQIATKLPLWDESMAAFHSKQALIKTSDVLGPVEVDASLWSGEGDGGIHIGSVVSMPAVVLESDRVLSQMRDGFSNAVGVEMEGYWFHRALSHLKGLYIYYTSDLPLAEDSNLAHEDTSLFVEEGQCLFNGLVRMAFKHMLKHAL